MTWLVASGVAVGLTTVTAGVVWVAQGPGPDAPEAPEPAAPRGITVTRVVDGDTLDLSTGARVRLVGVDAPERGECGYAAATTALTKLAEGKQVRMSRPRRVDNRDRWDRLLRYVHVNHRDLALILLKRGLVSARYDSLDGYPRHTRQKMYRSVDARVDSRCERRERIERQRWREATRVADRAGIEPRKHETAAQLLRRANKALQQQRQQARQALRQERRERRQPLEPPAPPSTGGGFTPPQGWTTDALTPGYTGCRQGYPGGRINGIYVWKPIPC